MKLLSHILLATLLMGCSTVSHNSQVNKIANAAVTATAKQTGLPENNATVKLAAKSYLKVAELGSWIGLEVSKSVSDPVVGKAIQDALPSPSLTENDVRLLAEASNAIR